MNDISLESDTSTLCHCPVYPCFDTLTGAVFRRDPEGRIIFDCKDCSWKQKRMNVLQGINSLYSKSNIDTIDTIEDLFFLKNKILAHTIARFNSNLPDILTCLKNICGICDNMHVLTDDEKKRALEIEKKDRFQNIGVYSALTRDISIAIAHNSAFRNPPLPVVLLIDKRNIVGEMTSHGKRFYSKETECDYVLPPIDFFELEPFGKHIVSSSPGFLLDTWLRKKMALKKDDATLIIGINTKL